MVHEEMQCDTVAKIVSLTSLVVKYYFVRELTF